MAARASKSLERYQSKRNFRRSPEPSGKGEGKGGEKNEPLFVIQQHRARSMHYDFRLEVDGVLASWAVPKGPSTDPRDKRLAVHVEDHPLGYAEFEGNIPQDEYGAGAVIVWDTGTYRNLRGDDDGNEVSMPQAIEDGTVEIWLNGQKLQGGYALVHSKMGGKEENWLLIKMKDDAADARRNPIKTEPKSVLSGRTVEEVAAEQDSQSDD